MTPGFDDIAGKIRAQATDLAHQEAAQRVAQIARDNGLPSADSIEITRGDDSGLNIDVDRVRSLANGILRSNG